MEATPAEVLSAAEQRIETDITQAWMTALMTKLHPFPKSPKEVFKKGGDQQSYDHMLAAVQALKREKDREKRRKVAGRDVIIHRPEK